MMPSPLLLTVVLVLGAVTASQAATPPIACRPGALDKAQRKRQQELLDLMRRSAQAKEELADGYRFRLAPEPGLFQAAAEWVSLERRCCPFVRFALEWQQDDSIWVRLTGEPGVKEAIAAEMGLSGAR